MEKMPTIFWKSLFKCFPTPVSSTNPLPTEQDDSHLPPLPSSKVSNCSNTTTTSIAIKTFNSLYDISSASTSKSLSTPSTNSFTSTDSGSDIDSPLDFATIFASQRFFFSSPGLSNSIIDQSSDTLRGQPEPETPMSGGIAVKKFSPDPYTDFKDSMQEMIEARQLKDVKADWDYLHELLSCYLSLNPKHTHKFIISAFADTVVCLLSSSTASPESETDGKPDGLQRPNSSTSGLLPL